MFNPEATPYRVIWTYEEGREWKITHSDYASEEEAELAYNGDNGLHGIFFRLLNVKLLVLRDKTNWKKKWRTVKRRYERKQ